MKVLEEKDATRGEEILTTRLANGLLVRAIPKPLLKQSCGLLAIDFGSTDQRVIFGGKKRPTRLPAGLAHFLEHKMFEKPEGDLFEKFSAGGAQANAMTGHSITGYYFVATSSVLDHLDTLLDVVFVPHFTDALVEKEFGIIDQEIRGYDDSPAWRAWRMLLENLYWKHPAREDIAGTSESIREIDAALLHAVHGGFYHPKNMVLTLAGQVDLEAVVARAEAYFAARPKAPARAESLAIDEPDRIKRKVSKVHMEVAMPRLLLGYKGPGGRPTPKEALLDDAAASLALEVLLGEASPVHEQLYAEGLIAEDFTVSATVERDFRYAWLGGTTPDPAKLAKRLEATLLDGLRAPLDARRLEAARRKMIGEAVRLYDQPESLAWALAESTLRKQTLLGWPDVLADIGERTVRKRATSFFAEGCSARVEVLPMQRGT